MRALTVEKMKKHFTKEEIEDTLSELTETNCKGCVFNDFCEENQLENCIGQYIADYLDC